MNFNWGGAAAGASAGSALSSLFGKNPYSGMQDEYSQFKKYITPYYDAGTNALGQYQSALSGLMANPTGLEDSIMSHYHQSPYAHNMENEITKRMNNQAAITGTINTPDENYALENQLGRISSADQQQYLHNAMQPYEFGASGMGNVSNMGLSALNQLQKYYGNMANARSAQQAYNNQSTGGLFGALGSLIGGLF